MCDAQSLRHSITHGVILGPGPPQRLYSAHEVEAPPLGLGSRVDAPASDSRHTRGLESKSRFAAPEWFGVTSCAVVYRGHAFWCGDVSAHRYRGFDPSIEEADADAMRAALFTHDEVVHAAIEIHGG